VDGLSNVQFSAAPISAVGLSGPVSRQNRPHPAMDAAEQLLGMSASDLRTAMQSGQSLASIASSKGINQDALTAAMAAAIQQANPTITSDQASKVATAIATRTPQAGGPPAGDAAAASGTTGASAASGHHHHHHHAGAAAMGAASQTLGMSTTDLMSALQSGQSLTDIAKTKGVSVDALTQAMAAALQGADSNLTANQATSIATQMVTQTPGSANQPWSANTGQASPSTYSITA
jgi:uncharacterized protein YidB (DUF937 family)